MTTQYWITGTAGDWLVAADWQSGVVPGSTDNVVINNSISNSIAVPVTVDGTAAANSLALTGSTTLTVGGALTLGTSLTLDDGGIMLSGGTLSAQSIVSDNGNEGGLSGYGTISGAITGNVFLYAQGGTLTIEGSLAGDSSDYFVIGAGATLELTNSCDNGIDFAYVPSSLKLDAPTTFTGSILTIAAGDTIDLAGIIANSATYSGTTLTINETNGQHLTYNVSDNVIDTAGLTVTVASDNSGGTLVTWTQLRTPTEVSLSATMDAAQVVTITMTTSEPVTVVGEPALQLEQFYPSPHRRV